MMNPRTLKLKVYCILAICVWAIVSMPQSFAQCLPGIPCVTGYTPNDPYNPPIDPNESGPNAPKTDMNTCDADFMNQIYSRAWLESEREHLLAELLIAKPDSTLEYSCYEQIVSMTAEIAGPLFNESDYWWNKSIPINGRLGFDYISDVIINVHMCEGDIPCDKLDISLENLVLEALKSYVDTEFSHDYIGGQLVGINNDITGSISNYYLCDYISLVHFMAKCNDFATYDQFFTFEQLIGLDPRIFPNQCPGGTAITQGHIDLARNEGGGYSFINFMSDIYRDKIEPGQCADPIPTGVRVARKTTVFDPSGGASHTFDEYDEHVCVNPGCTYVPSQGCQ